MYADYILYIKNHTFPSVGNLYCDYTCQQRRTPISLRPLDCTFSRWMYVLSFTGGSNAGGGRINTSPPEAAMPEVEEKINLLVNRLED